MHDGDILPLLLVFCKASLHTRFIKDCVKQQFDVMDVDSASIFFEFLDSIPVDVVIIDERVIDRDIEGFMRQVQHKQQGSLPVILISSNLKKSFDDQMKSLGVVAILRDPLTKEMILTSLKGANRKDLLKHKVSGLLKSRLPEPKAVGQLSIHQRILLNPKAQEMIKKLLADKSRIALVMVEGTVANPQEDSKMGAIIAKHCRIQDVMIPLGGGKCVWLMPKTSLAVAKHLAEEIQADIRSEMGQEVAIGISLQDYVLDESVAYKHFQHALTKAISFAILAKQKNDKLMS